jgi:hypothetical protein
VKHNDYRSARNEYAARHRAFRAEHEDRERASARTGAARLAVFAAAAAIVAAGVAGFVPDRIAIPVAIVLTAAFAWLVRAHARIRRDAERFALLSRVNELAERRSCRAWDALPAPARVAVPEDHPYAEDLGLFGRASLWQLLPETSPAPARVILAGWLCAPAPPDIVRDRQAAVAELLPRIDFRDDLTALAVQLEGVPPDLVTAATRLPEAIAWLDGERWLIPAARALTVASLATWALIAAGTIPLAAGGVALVICGAFSSATGRRFRRTFARADALATALPWYADLIDRVAAERLASPLLRKVADTLVGDGRNASQSLRELRGILARAEVRHSGMLHLTLQVLGLWDHHVAHALHRWCREHGAHIAPWLHALGEVEALAAFAALHHANPSWCVPLVREAGSRDDVCLTSRRIGHPLLPPDAMVANDLTIGPPGTFVLVTGSNMSGKSTLLRAAGLNAVLAQAGAPACAAALELPPLRVHTSIRVHDSLRDGISLFMAELKRLRRVVDAAEEPAPAAGVLYLLDEMLQGTNSAERHVAARTVLARLVRSRAIGLVTTHDVALATAPELTAVARTVYFDESVRVGDVAPLSFDYRLRDGIVPAGNALKLLSLVGLANPPNR